VNGKLDDYVSTLAQSTKNTVHKPKLLFPRPLATSLFNSNLPNFGRYHYSPNFPKPQSHLLTSLAFYPTVT
jgi:hypothetical protein